jgi:hypothetical protein
MSINCPPLPASLLERLRVLREGGASFNAIAADLNRCGVPGRQGGRWFAASVRRALLQSGASLAPSPLNHQGNKQGAYACLD